MNTLYDMFIQIFGEYEPIMVIDQVTEQTVDCINFGYIFSCLFACVALYGILRIIGSMFSRK